MVRCSDVELMVGLKKRKKSSKRKEPTVLVKAEAIPTMSAEKLAATEVPLIPTEVQGEAKVTIKSVEVHDAVEAPTERGSPSWAAEAS